MKRINTNEAIVFISDVIQKTICMTVNNHKKILVCSFLLGISGLILKLFDLITLFYIAVIIISASVLVYFKVKEINKVGVINYLPVSLKNAMLRRSIFDILMDIWYLPTLSQYIKLFVKPFFSKITPEEATKLLEDFSSGQRKFFLTKGIINIFPEKVKTILLPPEITKYKAEIKSKNILSEENHSDSTRSEILVNYNINNKSNGVVLYESPRKVENFNDKQPAVRKIKKIRNIQTAPFYLDKSGKLFLAQANGRKFKINRKRRISRNPSHSILSSGDSHLNSESQLDRKISIDSNENRIAEINLMNSDIQINEAHEIELPLINDNNEFANPLFSVCENNISKLANNPMKISSKEDYRYYEIDDDAGGKKVYRTVVLESSEKIKSQINRVSSRDSCKDLKNFCWDNLKKYYDQEAKKAQRGGNVSKSNFIQVFMKSLHQQIISKIDYNKLSKAFVIFCITLLVQMIISKKARRWSISLIQFLFYMITSLGAGGTLYFLLLKKK